MFDQKLLDIVATKDKKKKPKPLNKIFKGAKGKAPKGTHRMPNGQLMTGSVHTKDSKVVKAGKKKGARSKY